MRMAIVQCSVRSRAITRQIMVRTGISGLVGNGVCTALLEGGDGRYGDKSPRK